MGALASITVDFNVPVILTRDPKETAELLVAILRRSGPRDNKRKGRAKPKGPSLADTQVEVLSSLPGVSSTTAMKLLSKFGSLRQVFAATEEQLMEVEGIGRVKARELSSLLSGKSTGIGGNGQNG
jgi:Fanconi anemia group M protein